MRDEVQRIVHEEFGYWFNEQLAGPPGNCSGIAEVLWRRWNDTASTSMIHEHMAKAVRSAPTTGELAAALWGEGVDADSGGDPGHPWELTVALRSGDAERLDIP